MRVHCIMPFLSVEGTTTSSASRSKGRKQDQHNPLHANHNRGEKLAWRGVLEKEG